MPVTSLPQLLADAEKRRYAVGYFESWDLYSLEAVLAAAEAERSPVIIGIGGLSANHDWLGSVGLAHAIRAGDISAQEATEAAIAHVEATDAAAHICPTGAILIKRTGYQIPIGERIYDHKEIDQVSSAASGSIPSAALPPSLAVGADEHGQ